MGDKKHKIIDGDGHVVEDHSAIAARMPQQYRDRFGWLWPGQETEPQQQAQ